MKRFEIQKSNLEEKKSTCDTTTTTTNNKLDGSNIGERLAAPYRPLHTLHFVSLYTHGLSLLPQHGKYSAKIQAE
jgi:hypothetical protein